MTTIFIHGLDSNNKGTKAAYFAKHFPSMLIPNFPGDFAERMEKLHDLLTEKTDITLIGSSFGGLMAAGYALSNPEKTKKVILLAPALNFPDFIKYADKTTSVPTWCYIGKNDDVTPLDTVEPLVKKTFSNLRFHAVDDDHLLHSAFTAIDWETLIME